MKITYLILLIFLASCATPQVTKKIFPTSKEVECIEGISGKSYKYLAWGIGASNSEAEDDALRAAVYAALINSGAGNCTSIMTIAESERNGPFLIKFFEDGIWNSFITNTNRGRIDPGKRLKMDDGMIKLGIEAVVETTALRNYLIEKGIIKSMRIGG